ncbi:MAG: hypothetical protein CVU44_08715 [Chloroflexi bacterium HGW-Chloroflexi-6]|nr:MAG: hypothetical protein CVU44_08715 [Chloroflexi bacterium HGW-Chloroflexi-6]
MSKASFQLGLLSATLIFFTLWNTLRTVRALLDWQTLVEYGAPAVYILLSGAFWILTGLFFCLKVLQGWPHSVRAGIGISVLYWVWYWTDRLFIQQSPAPNLLFSAIFSTIFLLVIVLLWRSPDIQALFTKETE